MDKPKSNLHFRVMSFAMKFRNLFMPPQDILKEVEIKPGFHVLDFGCGPGTFTLIASEAVGKSGKIYALDIHPLAVQKVQSIALKNQLANVETICSDCKTELPDNSMDVVLLYDTFHLLGNPSGVLEEIHRVLKPNGILSFSDHHMKENEIMSSVVNGGLFKLAGKGKRTYSLLKEG
jgi:ubiquinone/menaquinone biosynthesis C-methylase UbiE